MGSTTTLSPTTTNVTGFNALPTSTAEPLTKVYTTDLSRTTTNVTGFDTSPASTAEPPTTGSTTTLSQTTNVNGFSTPSAGTAEPSIIGSTTDLSPTTINVTELSPLSSSTAEPLTTGSASTLSTTTNPNKYSPSSTSTAEPPTTGSRSTSSPTIVTEFSPTKSSTSEPFNIGSTSTLPPTMNITEFSPSSESTTEPTAIGSTTTTSTTTNIIPGTTSISTVLPSAAQSTSVTSATSTTAILSELTSPVTKELYTGQCVVIAESDSSKCTGVSSADLQVYLDSGTISGRFCSFSVEEFACASLSALTAQDLVEIMKCDRSSNSSGSISAWNLLFCKTSKILNEALNLLTTTTINPTNPSVSVILDSIQSIYPDIFSSNTLNNPTELQLWFNVRLRPFLPAVSTNFLSTLATKDLQCSSYQYILQILSEVQSQMTPSRQESVYTQFIKIYLSRNNTADPGCTLSIQNSLEWLRKNVGGFSVLLSIQNIQELYPQFSGLGALPLLSVTQLAEVAAAPGQLTTAEQVTTIMNYVPDKDFASFFDGFSPKILGRENILPSTVRSAMLQVVFDRANLSSPSVSDSVVLLWLQVRLRPLLVNLVPDQVTPYYNILAGRSCSIQQQGVTFLNSTISTLSDATRTKIQDQIALALKGPSPLRCYGDSYSVSFYRFLRSSFLGFQFPSLTTFLSLMPQDRKPQLINSMPPSDLGDFLRQTNVVGEESQLCQLYSSYLQIPLFLETESLPEPLRQRTLPCVWPLALRSSSRSEVNAWFDRGLPNYLVFLTKTQISQITSINASCLAFQKIVSALGSYNYSVSDFTNQDVYNTIKVYLSSATVPKCYDSNNPDLNSTAWFAEYIGSFITFLTVADLQSFGSELVLRVFTVNPKNIALLSQPKVNGALISYYTQLVYQQASNFNPLLLPSVSQCYAPGPVFTQLNANDSMNVLKTLKVVCTNLDEQISAALASNLKSNIDSSFITALGNESSSLSISQIKTISSSQLMASLSTLSIVTGWREGQARLIIQTLLSSGVMKINSSSSLSQLGSLVIGLSSNTFSSIISSELVSAAKNPSFVTNLLSGSQILQQSFVYQIVSSDTNSLKIIDNIPDQLATQVPRVYLQQFTSDAVTIGKLNKKTWKRQQVELFFDIIAADSATTTLGSPDSLSSSVLQGLTCTGVSQFSRTQVTKLVKACRRKGSSKVPLLETQLTCMYNYIRTETDVTSFALYPPDMLLYYDYSLVPQSSCRSYFQELADADFTIFSSVLSYKKTTLFNNARSCLGITNTSLTADHVSVLGNMCCMLDGSYIQNSDPSILEKLKNCPDLTASQAAAVTTLLTRGNTQYGNTSTWNQATLTNLDMLPLYLPTTFYDFFDRNTKKTFLKSFLKEKGNGVSRYKRRDLKSVIRQSIKNRSKRTTDCTVGEITQVIISASTFPLDYDVVQFNNCLSNVTVKDNFDAITEKVDEVDYLKIVLQKLGEAYNFIIPEDQVQVLGFASRVATIGDIRSWTITQVDTLSALMDSSNGDWDPSLAREIISKYLAVAGNTLGRAELNAIKGPNLCTLDLSVIQSISVQNLKEAEALNITSCTLEAKNALFKISSQSFRATTRASPSYLLSRPFLGGASLDYIRGLVPANISMDLETFSNLDSKVVLNLTVTEVKGLLGTNLPDLKSYENQTLVQTWIRSQYQSELNTLGLNLSGGKADPVTTATGSPTATAATTVAGSGSGGSSTTGSGVRIQADTGFSFLLFLAILLTSQLITF